MDKIVNVPDEWQPSKQRLDYFLNMCNGKWGSNDCIIWNSDSSDPDMR